MKKWVATCALSFVVLFAALCVGADKNDSLAWQEGGDVGWGISRIG